MNDEVREKAEAAYRAWEAWADADGWDNPEYDVFGDAMEDLGIALGIEPAAWMEGD